MEDEGLIVVGFTPEEADALKGVAEYTLGERGAWPDLDSAAKKIDAAELEFETAFAEERQS